MAVAIFFFSHWFSSLFAQTFFLHRYAAHKMFELSRFTERFFFFFTWVAQGSSFLNPRAYAILHRMHHAYSDTEKDPHSPHYFRNVFTMLWKTKEIYASFFDKNKQIEFNFDKDIPEWSWLERFGDSWFNRIAWGVGYTLFYLFFAKSWWVFLLLPIHYLMGPIHGGIVNWCGHKYGYINFFDTKDRSRNTLPVDFLTMGELFQNNHHRYPSKVNFACRWFEIDPAYLVMKVMHWVRLIHIPRSKETISYRLNNSIPGSESEI